MDDILFKYDLLVCGLQGNGGGPENIEQAFAKNIVSVGGVHHNDSPGKGDDRWRVGESYACTGPASDGRIKPDFTHFNDLVYTTNLGGGYIPDFGGTSAATPITCGHFGLFFQMWADGIFGNTLNYPNCNPGVDNCVFKNRPHMTTAKAMMINTASQYPFSGSGEDVDMTRTHQGWGLVQVGRLHILRSHFPVIVDETRLLDLTPENDTADYSVVVPPDMFALRATLVYADPPGPADTFPPPGPLRHAVHDLTLKVTEPNGTTVYWGNCGLRESNWSSSACTSGNRPFPNDPDTVVIDTVENVFVQTHVSGTWTVRVMVEQMGVDYSNVDFALVVSLDPDCNGNGRSDADDILGISPHTSPDCNNNSIPDECDIANGVSEDCNENGVPDECDGTGACCLSYSADDCVDTPSSGCCDALSGVWWYPQGQRA